MRALAFLLLTATAAHGQGFGWLGDDSIHGSGGLGQSFGAGGAAAAAATPPILEFAPDGGAGLQSIADLCDTYAAEMTGAYFCLRGDGTSLSGSQALTATGSPVISSTAVCPSGVDCTTASSIRFAGGQAYETGNAASPAGDFSVCVLMQTELLDGPSVISKDDGTTRAFYVRHLASGAGEICIRKTGGSFVCTSTAVSLGPEFAWNLVCGTYDYVTDGTSILIPYMNATAGAGSAVMAGPPMAGSSKFRIGANFGEFYRGRIRAAFYTEKVLTPTTIAAMTRTALADRPTGTLGEALTFTRASTKFCVNAAGTAGSFLSNNRPCIAGGGIHIEGANTNLTLYNVSLGDWTRTNVNAIAANTAMSPAGTLTAESATSTVAGGYVESNTAAIAGTSGSASIWVNTASGTQAVALILRDTTAAADKCTATVTATTTPARLTCSATVVSGNSHSLRFYPGGTAGTGTAVAWCGQQEASAFPTSCIITGGTTVARSADSASFAAPALLSNTAGCVGARAYVRTVGSFPSVVQFGGGGIPLSLQTFKDFLGHDSTNSSSVADVASDVRVSPGVYFTQQWSVAAGLQMKVPATAAVGAVQPTYDGTMIGTVYLGSSNGTSAFLNGTVSGLKLGATPGGCD